MGGSIYLQRKGSSTIAIETMLSVSKHIMNHYGNYFYPKMLEVWEDAPSAAIGGIARFQNAVTDIDSTQKQIRDYVEITDPLFIGRSVFRVIGEWRVKEVKRQGYMSLNFQADWRAVYGDISLTLYPTNELRDLVFLFWKSPSLRSELTDAFLERMGKLNKGKKLFNRIYFAKGEPSPTAARDFMATYYAFAPQIYEDLLLTVETEAGQKVQRNIFPYKRNIILDTLSKINAANERLETILKRNEIQVDRSNSISLIAAKEGSFAKAVDMITSKVLLPAFSELYDLPLLRKRMEEGIRKTELDL